jgi:hypothetical protein
MRSYMIVLGATLSLALACDEPVGSCAALGHVINVGDRVVDHEANVVCTCTKDGPVCTPIPLEVDAGGRLNDASMAGSGGQGGEGGQVPADLGPGGQGGEDAGAGGAPDEGVLVEDAAVADVGPPDPEDCPAERPRGRCGGLVGLRCSYGAEPFLCCDREYAAEVRCACDEDALWTCVDQRANCVASAAGRNCLREVDVCAAWQRIVTDRDADQAHLAAWNGDVDACDAGDMGAEWRAQALARLNDWRILGDMPTVEVDASRNEMAQACALAMKAGGVVTHHLEPDAPCFSPDAQAGAAGSNVMIGAGPIESFWHYMEDWGQVNVAGLPHRLWMLSNRLGPVGLGATDITTCMHVANGGGQAGRDYVKWPPAGVFPFDAHRADETGWSIQSDSMNMNEAFITVVRTDDNQDMPITQRRLEAQGGAAHGQAFVPDGWSPQAGDTYLISMAGVRQPLEYEVRFVDCGVVEP